MNAPSSIFEEREREASPCEAKPKLEASDSDVDENEWPASECQSVNEDSEVESKEHEIVVQQLSERRRANLNRSW